MSFDLQAYRDFLGRKQECAIDSGFHVGLNEIHPFLKPHQKAAVQWAVRGGRRALFEAFGLGKTGETVLDPFGGLMTVPFRCIPLKRFGIGIELNPAYYLDGLAYCQQAEKELDAPTLFDLVKTEEESLQEVSA